MLLFILRKNEPVEEGTVIDASLINLPWATLVTLASGYIGYFIANVGLKDHHKPVEITFATLIFGLFSSIAYQGTILLGLGEYPAALAAVIYSFACGAYWRKYGRRLMYRYLRDHDISWSDYTYSAWQQMFGHTQYRVTEIFVYLKDGSGLLSRLPATMKSGLMDHLHWAIMGISACTLPIANP